MKAAFRSKYGPPEVLQIIDVEIPTPKENEVLIKVHATTVNRTDCGILWGKPFILKFFTGLFKPRISIMGSDFAGQIEAVGSAVKSFKPGQRVMGFGGVGIGSQAQYLAIPGDKGIILIPGKLSYAQAAASVEGAFYASVGINYLKPKAGQKALVNGATGAIGSSYVQFFKYYGVYITAVCSSENSELVKSLGADRIIDYKTQDFTKDSEQYDFIINTVPVSSFAKCKRLLKRNGVYLPSDGLENLLLAPITRLMGGKKIAFPIPNDVNGGLRFISDLIEKGAFKPVIDRTYPIEEIAEAYIYVASGQKIGNVIISIDEI